MKGLFLCDDITASKDLSKLISCKNILRVKKSLKSEKKQPLSKQLLSLIYRKRKILQKEQQRLEVLLGGSYNSNFLLKYLLKFQNNSVRDDFLRLATFGGERSLEEQVAQLSPRKLEFDWCRGDDGGDEDDNGDDKNPDDLMSSSG